MKHCITGFLFLFALTASAQEKFNDYKYLQVASQYKFQSAPNQYDFNDLAIFLLKKNGFTVLKNGGVLPADYNVGTCNALTVNMEASGMLKQKLVVDFVDCAGDVVYSYEGNSNFKDYRKAYHEALRRALKPLENFTHQYVAKNEMIAARDQFMKNEPVVTQVAATYQESPADTDTPETQNIYSHTSTNAHYKLLKTSSDAYTIFNNDRVAGAMRKASNGNFIVQINNTNGIGYFIGDNLIVEYEVQGNLEKQVFAPTTKK